MKHNVDLEMYQIEAIKHLLALVDYDEAALEYAGKIPLFFLNEETKQKVLGKGV